MNSTSVVRNPRDHTRGSRSYLPSVVDPAIIEGRTVYPSTVRDPAESGAILKSGHNNSKLGKVILKGRWKGMPMYSLTLEERATCPRTCTHWRSCFGNNMNKAQRWKHGPEFERYLVQEVVDLQNEYPGGFVIRLHVLGDFYSADYVRLWRAMMDVCTGCHVFGFTARIDPDCPITQEIAAIRRAYPDRWWVRFSNAPINVLATETISMPGEEAAGSIVCPQQLGKTLACATCGLCWTTKRNIAFVRH